MKKVVALFLFISLFACSKDDDPEIASEPLETSVVLRIEDENGLTFSDIQGDFFSNGATIGIFDEATWQDVAIDIQSYEDYEANISIANQIGMVDSSGTSEIILTSPTLFQDTETETIYFSIYSSFGSEHTNNFVSVSITEGDTKEVTLTVALDFTFFEN